MPLLLNSHITQLLCKKTTAMGLLVRKWILFREPYAYMTTINRFVNRK